MSRIQLTDTTKSMIVKMSEGNPGALRVLCECLKDGGVIDPDGIMGGLGLILSMDTLRLYGSRIWMLYADVCHHDLRCTVGVLRAWQLGFVSPTTINHAIENYGAGMDVATLVAQVEEKLPHFQRVLADAKETKPATQKEKANDPRASD